MSDEDDEITNALSDGDRLEAELRQLLWTYVLLAIGFLVLIGSTCYIFDRLRGG